MPHCSRLLVIEYERVVVCPAGGRQGQHPAVDFAAVHGREIHERSVARGHRFASQMAVGDFMPG